MFDWKSAKKVKKRQRFLPAAVVTDFAEVNYPFCFIYDSNKVAILLPQKVFKGRNHSFAGLF